MHQFLTNDFLNVCHFGYSHVSMSSYTIFPPVLNEDLLKPQTVFLLKMRIGTEHTVMYLQKGKILTPTNKFSARITSPTERLQVELYQVMSETAISEKADFENLKMLGHTSLSLDEVPFVEGNAELPILIQTSFGCVARFNVEIRFQRSVPDEHLGLPLSKE